MVRTNGNLAGNSPGFFNCEEFSIMRKGGEKHRISFANIGMGNGLEPTPGTRDRPDSIQVQPCCEILVEPRYGRLADIIEPVGFAAVITDRISIAIRDDGFHCIRSEPSPCLERIDIDKAVSYTHLTLPT